MLSEDMGYGSCQAGSRHRDRPIRAARKLQEARTDPGILQPSGTLGTDATFALPSSVGEELKSG